MSADRAVRTGSAEETAALGAELAYGLEAGDVVVVSGDVGTGKSTLIRGAARSLGVEGPIASPTFTIGRRYRGRLPVSHLDLYRLGSLEAEEPGLLDDYLTPDAIAFVEWPAAAEPSLRRIAARVRLRHAGGDERIVEISPAAYLP
ncbi:MAG TPA: tRNA (adenosine(37)-N6)-threonylcarbamoyltransferase complex ATPase subunit type 1 TsaE [Solirubrobacterales bacterium]|nr:tRNA (adenosine(37)-N6)-threonylcarbamoyltransferase complex ATPase subunit type 1 TsaE [Solirubrobacterales bacterium]